MTAFDLDDTLAPSKAPLPDAVREALLRLLAVTQVCVISGGQIEQFRTQVVERLGQLPDDLAVRLHLMPTCGTQYWRVTSDGLTCVYAEDLTDDEKQRALSAVEEETKRLGQRRLGWRERVVQVEGRHPGSSGYRIHHAGHARARLPRARRTGDCRSGTPSCTREPTM